MDIKSLIELMDVEPVEKPLFKDLVAHNKDIFLYQSYNKRFVVLINNASEKIQECIEVGTAASHKIVADYMRIIYANPNVLYEIRAQYKNNKENVEDYEQLRAAFDILLKTFIQMKTSDIHIFCATNSFLYYVKALR